MEPERTRMNWSGWLSLQSSIFGVVTFVCILIWALTAGEEAELVINTDLMAVFDSETGNNLTVDRSEAPASA